MKQRILISLLLFASSTTAFCQQNDFKFQGDLPEGKFVILEEEDQDIVRKDGDAVPLRNRIYVIFDSLGHVYLNGHHVPTARFEADFKYVLTNPDNHDHLPGSIQSAFIFTNFLELNSGPEFDDVAYFKLQYLTFCMRKVFQEQMAKFITNGLQKDWETLDSNDLKILMEKFEVKVAIRDRVESFISIELPDWTEDEDVVLSQLKQRNVLNIFANADNQLLVRGEYAQVVDLKDRVKAFILNPDNDPENAESPMNAIISLKNDRGTHYKFYLEVYNEIRAAYLELWDERALEMFGRPFDELSYGEKSKIREMLPIKIIESEPTSTEAPTPPPSVNSTGKNKN